MTLRVRPAHWFELLLARPQLPQALDLLARTGQVELEARPERGWKPIDLDSLRPALNQAQQMRRRYASLWPPPRRLPEPPHTLPAEQRLSMAIGDLNTWRQAAWPYIMQMERARAQRSELELVADFLHALGDDRSLEFGRLAHPGGQLAATLLVLPPEAPPPGEAAALLVRQLPTTSHRYVLVLGLATETAGLAASAGGCDARLLRLPDWLDGTAAQALAQVRDRIGALDSDIESCRRRIDEINGECRVASALGELDRLQWLTDHLATLAASEHLIRVTGWTLAADPQSLLAPLTAAGVTAVAGFSPPPPGFLPPSRSDNPRWVRPFEFFLRLAGTPGGNETDPSLLVAFVAPLLFGYMFGDVGQGTVLLLAGLLLRRRWPATAMLIPGGLLAIVFGGLFGSVFASTHLLGPLWTDPIRDPLPVLAVPLGFGAVLIVGGLLLNGLSLFWSGRPGQWLQDDAGLLLVYLAGWALLLDRRLALATALAGALGFIAAMPRDNVWRALPGRVGEWVERLLQMLVNTLSFLRVGAFALAHAGLSLAIVALTGASVSPVAKAAIVVFGNLLILSLEGLVVGIQTTRLVLFEFFVRFVRGEGRPFRPLSPSSA